jgi:hypothetical protein
MRDFSLVESPNMTVTVETNAGIPAHFAGRDS